MNFGEFARSGTAPTARIIAEPRSENKNVRPNTRTGPNNDLTELNLSLKMVKQLKIQDEVSSNGGILEEYIPGSEVNNSIMNNNVGNNDISPRPTHPNTTKMSEGRNHRNTETDSTNNIHNNNNNNNANNNTSIKNNNITNNNNNSSSRYRNPYGYSSPYIDTASDLSANFEKKYKPVKIATSKPSSARQKQRPRQQKDANLAEIEAIYTRGGTASGSRPNTNHSTRGGLSRQSSMQNGRPGTGSSYMNNNGSYIGSSNNNNSGRSSKDGNFNRESYGLSNSDLSMYARPSTTGTTTRLHTAVGTRTSASSQQSRKAPIPAQTQRKKETNNRITANGGGVMTKNRSQSNNTTSSNNSSRTNTNSSYSSNSSNETSFKRNQLQKKNKVSSSNSSGAINAIADGKRNMNSNINANEFKDRDGDREKEMKNAIDNNLAFDFDMDTPVPIPIPLPSSHSTHSQVLYTGNVNNQNNHDSNADAKTKIISQKAATKEIPTKETERDSKNTNSNLCMNTKNKDVKYDDNRNLIPTTSYIEVDKKNTLNLGNDTTTSNLNDYDFDNMKTSNTKSTHRSTLIMSPGTAPHPPKTVTGIPYAVTNTSSQHIYVQSSSIDVNINTNTNDSNSNNSNNVDKNNNDNKNNNVTGPTVHDITDGDAFSNIMNNSNNNSNAPNTISLTTNNNNDNNTPTKSPHPPEHKKQSLTLTPTSPVNNEPALAPHYHQLQRPQSRKLYLGASEKEKTNSNSDNNNNFNDNNKSTNSNSNSSSGGTRASSGRRIRHKSAGPTFSRSMEMHGAEGVFPLRVNDDSSTSGNRNRLSRQSSLNEFESQTGLDNSRLKRPPSRQRSAFPIHLYKTVQMDDAEIPSSPVRVRSGSHTSNPNFNNNIINRQSPSISHKSNHNTQNSSPINGSDVINDDDLETFIQSDNDDSQDDMSIELSAILKRDSNSNNNHINNMSNNSNNNIKKMTKSRRGSLRQDTFNQNHDPKADGFLDLDMINFNNNNNNNNNNYNGRKDPFEVKITYSNAEDKNDGSGNETDTYEENSNDNNYMNNNKNSSMNNLNAMHNYNNNLYHSLSSPDQSLIESDISDFDDESSPNEAIRPHTVAPAGTSPRAIQDRHDQAWNSNYNSNIIRNNSNYNNSNILNTNGSSPKNILSSQQQQQQQQQRNNNINNTTPINNSNSSHRNIKSSGSNSNSNNKLGFWTDEGPDFEGSLLLEGTNSTYSEDSSMVNLETSLGEDFLSLFAKT